MISIQVAKASFQMALLPPKRSPARSGMMTSDDKPTFTPANPLGSTPTMVKGT